MPEGPEIWRVAGSLSAALEGAVITGVYFAFEHMKEYEKRLEGHRITKVEARSKALLTFFDNDLVLYSHNQLYGKWFILESGEVPDTNRQLRVALHNNRHSAFLYSASEIEILKRPKVEEHSYIKNIGPDILHPDTTLEVVLNRYHDEQFKNRKLTTLLLDQGFLGGLGNYLRSEILFVAGVDPAFKAKDCSDEQIKRLAEASLVLPRRSYETKGITTDKTTVQALKREGAPRSEYRHYVYGRTDRFCHKCGQEIREINSGGRKVYYCPGCQKSE